MTKYYLIPRIEAGRLEKLTPEGLRALAEELAESAGAGALSQEEFQETCDSGTTDTNQFLILIINI